MKNFQTAMVDKDGNPVTCPEGIKQEAMNHFKEVLKNRPIIANIKEYQEERESLCKERIKAAGTNITPCWDVKDVSYVKKNLKKKKSCDPHGYPNDLIQCGGKDVTFAITKLINGINKEQIFPHFLQACNITSLYKNKGSKNDCNMHRGVFWVSVFRNILDRLIFNDEYETVEKHLTDSNVGGRRGGNIRDNIFVLNAITNSIRKGNEETCDVIVTDVEKCFDALWAQECINTLYEYGLDNDKFVLFYEGTLYI